MRTPHLSVFIACIALFACAGPTPADLPSSQAASVPSPGASSSSVALAAEDGFSGTNLGLFSKRRAMRHVRVLAGDIGVRVRGTRGETRGAAYFADRLRAFGYRVYIQKFEVDGKTSRNVLAWWPGARKYPFVIGGHMDSVPTSPGANDNASGVAAILEVARLVAGKEQARWLRFVAFGAEEYGTNGRHHVGSTVFVNRLGSEGRRWLAGMVSVDMVADGRPLLVGNSGIAEDVVARTLYRIIDAAGIATTYRTSCDCSDNGPFEHAGIPAGYMWSGPEPNYHDSSDTVGNMVPEDLLRSGRALRAFVKRVDQEMLQRFRRRG